MTRVTCPWCYTPHSNPLAKDGYLTREEENLAKTGGLNRMCLACGKGYTIHINATIALPGLTSTRNAKIGPMNERGEYPSDVGRFPKAFRSRVWLKTIAPELRRLRNEGYTIDEISRIIKRGRRKVTQWLKQLGLQKRSVRR